MSTIPRPTQRPDTLTYRVGDVLRQAQRKQQGIATLPDHHVRRSAARAIHAMRGQPTRPFHHKDV